MVDSRSESRRSIVDENCVRDTGVTCENQMEGQARIGGSLFMIGGLRLNMMLAGAAGTVLALLPRLGCGSLLGSKSAAVLGCGT